MAKVAILAVAIMVAVAPHHPEQGQSNTAVGMELLAAHTLEAAEAGVAQVARMAMAAPLL
jgi:hypothetical protein